MCLLFAAMPIPAADWPTWRFDVRRSAASPEKLPRELHLRWVRKYPATKLAWPTESRLYFDVCYQPVISGKTLFFGSPNNDAVTAIDIESGKEKWKFYTGGPVRFAPVVWEGKVYFGSDDGYFYCLNAADKKLLWKFRGGQLDRNHLGNDRLISAWPVRVGPVIADGTVYLAAGIWPNYGVFVHALDARTGNVIWTNGELGLIKHVRLDHNANREGGISPQGYMLVAGDKLLVPNGRSMPAALDRKTGKLLWYLQGYRNGACNVTTQGNYVFVGKTAVLGIKNGKELGSRWDEPGSGRPDRFIAKKFAFFESPLFPYKMFHGCDANSVLTRPFAYGSHNGAFYCYDLLKGKKSTHTQEFCSVKYQAGRWDVPLVWKFNTGIRGSTGGELDFKPLHHPDWLPRALNAKHKIACDTIIKAGNRLFGHVDSTLIALDLPAGKGKPKISWKTVLPAIPGGIAAADGKLFVATRGGDICCFGAKPLRTKTFEQTRTALPEQKDQWTQRADALLKTTGAAEGFALVLGLDKGRLVEELLGRTRLRVIGIDVDEAKVEALRRKFDGAGLYGRRVALRRGDPLSFPLPPYFANLIVSEDLKRAGFDAGAKFARKVYASLRPYGGVACLTVPDAKARQFADWVNESKLENARSSRKGEFTTLARVGALPGAAYWTHEAADAGNTLFSRDDRARMPLGVLWYGDGPDYAITSHKDYNGWLKPLVAGGRMFAITNFLGKHFLRAADIFTGRLLWKRQVLSSNARYVATQSAVYLALGDGCLLLDATTGKPLKKFQYGSEEAGGGKARVRALRFWKDIIVVGLATGSGTKHDECTHLVALDGKDGQLLWSQKASLLFEDQSIAVGGGSVFCADTVTPNSAQEKLRKGQKLGAVDSTVMALDARKGTVLWKYEYSLLPLEYVGTRLQKASEEARQKDWLKNPLWFAYCERQGVLLCGRRRGTRVLDAKSGKVLWAKRISGQYCMVRDDTFITQGTGVFEIMTGKHVKDKTVFRRTGAHCAYGVASRHLMMRRDSFASYGDIDTEERHFLRNLRSGCSNSLVAADGLFSSPCLSWGCICNYPIQTAFALVPMPEVRTWPGATETLRAKREAAAKAKLAAQLASVEKVVLSRADLAWDFAKSPEGTLVCPRNPSHNGRIKGAKWVIDKERGRVLSFKKGDFVTLGNPDGLNVGKRDFALAGWVRFAQATPKPIGMIYTKGVFSNPSFNVYSSQSTGFRVQLRSQKGTSNRIVNTDWEFDKGKWHHFVASLAYAKREIRLYVDGKLIGAQAFPAGEDVFDNKAPAFIGGGGQPFQGEIGDLMIFRESFDELKALALLNVTSPKD